MAQAGYSQDQIEKWSTAYIKKAWKYRLEMIARTETARSATQGMLRAYSYMGIQAVKWIADPECCDACDEKNGKVYSVSQMREVPMEAPPLHPNCECVLVYTAAELPKSERGRTNIQIADDLKEKLGLERVEFRGILPDVSEEISELLQKLYKQMESYLEEVEVGSANANAYASTASSGDRITFAEGWYNNLDEMLDKLIENMRTKWHPRMKEKHLLPSVTLHEFVHSSGATQYWKLRNKKTEFWNELVEIMRPYYDLEDEWKEQVEMGMMTHEQFEKRLREIYPSGYAFESTDELIAEAVTDAVYGTETKEMSKKIYDLWIKHFSRKGGE
jgi:SPP1 gp7 family putative phage head morphogenesis protein